MKRPLATAVGLLVVVAAACSGRVNDPRPSEAGGGSGEPRGGDRAEGGGGEAGTLGTSGGTAGHPAGGNFGSGGSTSDGGSSTAGLGGDGADPGGAGGMPQTTVEAGGIVSVTYTPADDSTRVAVTIDPGCSHFASAVDIANTICAQVDVSGELSGDFTICFSRIPKNTLFQLCRIESHCAYPQRVYIKDGSKYCCDALGVPGATCVQASASGEYVYGIGLDHDGDFAPDMADNCPDEANFSQVDQDGDAIGNNCDNCILLPNQDQTDTDQDDVGDACDPTPNGDGSGGAGGAEGT